MCNVIVRFAYEFSLDTVRVDVRRLNIAPTDYLHGEILTIANVVFALGNMQQCFPVPDMHDTTER